MADSETSRTLPEFGNRNLLSKVAHLLKSNFPISATPAHSGVVPIHRDDPAIALWWKWFSGFSEVSRLGRTQARLETKLFSLARTPHIELTVDGKPEPIVVRTVEEIDWLMADEQARRSAKDRLSAVIAAWKQADAKVGYSEAKRAEEAAAISNEDAASRLWNSKAASIPGVIAKLHALVTTGQPSADTNEFPWPQLRLIMRDLVEIDTSRRPHRR
jgi:hypothetical protein